MRTSGNHTDIDHKVDKQNLIKVVSLIEKCGMPTLKEISKKQMSAIWLVFNTPTILIEKNISPY